MYKTLIACLLISVAVSSQIGEQIDLAVTIYNDNFAMVKDVRQIDFDQGQSALYFTDVSSNIQTQTVTFKALQDPASVRVYEQNFQKNLINTQGILKRYIDKQITVYVQLGDTTKMVKGVLLGHDSGYILKTRFGVNIFNNIAGVEFPSLPQDFFTLPTLNWKVWSQQARSTPCQVAYRTTGFKWKADYLLSLNNEETSADIGGWVTIDNNSGKKYIDAKLKLIAGDVNTISSNEYLPQPTLYRTAALNVADSSFESKAFADYHLYTLQRPVTLNQSSQKQVEFIQKVYNVPVDKYHEIRISAGGYSQQNLEAQNYVKFLNSDQNGLGIAFPKGIVRVFKTDEDDGSLEFIGQDRIDHTPKNQNITLNTGKAFDITANKYSVERRTFDKGGYQATLNMTVNNRKETQAKVVIKFNNGYADNLDFKWNGDVDIEEYSSTEYRWQKVLMPDEQWTVEWTEFYSR